MEQIIGLDVITLLESHLRTSSQKFPKRWSLFLARYRFVEGFSGIKFTEIKGNIAKGYEVGLKLALAHTALEALEGALGGKRQIVLRDKEISKLLRRLRESKFENYLTTSARSASLKSRIEAMFSSQKVADFRPLVEAIRNSVFHGAFTPGSSNFVSDRDVRLLLDLATHSVLNTINESVRAHYRALL